MVYIYRVSYDDPLMRGIEDERPWNLSALIQELSSPNKTLLDVGCGTGTKLLPLSSLFGSVIGVEPNPAMLQQAQLRIDAQKLTHVQLAEGYAHKLPINNSSIDVLTCMLSAHEVTEVFRVLKPNGTAIIEMQGELDKKTLKDYFFDAQQQPRGQFSYLPASSMHTINYVAFRELFQEVIVLDGSWDFYLTWEGLVSLLNNTPTIRDFNLERDATILKKAAQDLSTEKGIKLSHHRVLLIAKK